MSDHATMPTLRRSDRTRRPRTPAIDLSRITGYLVADRTGHLVGKVECAMYGTAPDLPDAVSVKSRPFSRHRLIVPANTIAEVDCTSGVVGLNVDRSAIRRFL